MLVYHDRAFLQFLEGNEQVIRELYKRISQDSRHTDCKIIYSQKADTRLFSNWFFRAISVSEYIKEITDAELAEDVEELLTRKIKTRTRLVESLTNLLLLFHLINLINPINCCQFSLGHYEKFL